MNKRIRVLLIENQTLVRIGIRTILEKQNDFEIAGEAATGAAGFELFKKLNPEITILSLRLPDSCAIDVLTDYFAFDSKAKIIVLADSAGDAEISKALKRGASSYICKDVSEEELITAIRAVHAGRKYIQPEVAAILSENLGQEELTPTEARILQQIAVINQSTMARAHLIFGIIVFIVFLITGQFMDGSFPDKQQVSAEFRLLMRSRHIYILLASFAHIFLGLYLQISPTFRRKVLQFAGSGFLALGSVLLIAAFFYETYATGHFSEMSRAGLYTSLAGTIFHLLSRFALKSKNE